MLTAALLALATLLVCAVRFTEPLALTPWESAIAMEAMRFKAGLPLYEPHHATHLYGPLLSVILAGVFALTGLNLLAARIVFSSFAFALVALLTWLLCRGELRRFAFLGALLFLAINLRTNFVFLSAQPDCLAAGLALLALVLWIRARGSVLLVASSLLLFLFAMLCKQTSAAFGLIPIAHAIFREGPRRVSTLAWSLMPAGFLLLSLVVIRMLHPALFHGMVEIPGALKIHYGRAPGMTLFLLATFPIFFIALIFRLLDDAELSLGERSICASLAVLVPISIWTTIKSGGGYNSLLFGYLALTAFVVSQLGRIARSWETAEGWRPVFASSTVAVAILCSFFFQFEKSIPILLGRSGDEKYPIAVEVARRLGPGVISPHDPTIAFRANGYYGRALYFELDSHAVNGEWPATLPDGMQRELDECRDLIAVQTYVPSPLTPEVLSRNGFHAIDVPPLRDSAYTVWTKRE